MQASQKRHPTLGDNVIVGSGAQILGPIMVGSGARIGANSVVLKNVAAGATVVGIPAKLLTSARQSEATQFDAYGMGSREIHDPQSRVLEGLLGKIHELSARVGQLEQVKSQDAPPGTGWSAESDENEKERAPE